MSLNTRGDRLYLTGLKGSTVYRTNGGNLENEFGLDTSLKSTMICSFPDSENMIMQVPNSNDLKLCERDLTEIQRMKGNFKAGTGKN